MGEKAGEDAGAGSGAASCDDIEGGTPGGGTARGMPGGGIEGGIPGDGTAGQQASPAPVAIASTSESVAPPVGAYS